MSILTEKYGSEALAMAVIITSMPDYNRHGDPFLGAEDLEQLSDLFLEVQGDIARLIMQLRECQQAFDTGREVERRTAGFGELMY